MNPKTTERHRRRDLQPHYDTINEEETREDDALLWRVMLGVFGAIALALFGCRICGILTQPDTVRWSRAQPVVLVVALVSAVAGAAIGIFGRDVRGFSKAIVIGMLLGTVVGLFG